MPNVNKTFQTLETSTLHNRVEILPLASWQNKVISVNYRVKDERKTIYCTEHEHELLLSVLKMYNEIMNKSGLGAIKMKISNKDILAEYTVKAGIIKKENENDKSGTRNKDL